MSERFAEFSGSLAANVLEFHPDAIPKPDTLVIRMTRGERRIADELRKAFGGFERVIIDVDGEWHEFDADSLIGLLESYEGARDTSIYAELFGTPELAALTLVRTSDEHAVCKLPTWTASSNDYEAWLEWLRGDA